MSLDTQLGRHGLFLMFYTVLMWSTPAKAAVAGQMDFSSGVTGPGFGVLVLGLILWWWFRRQRKPRVHDAVQSLQQVTSLIERANCLLWEARVTLIGDKWDWKMKFHPTVYARLFFGESTSAAEQVVLWHDVQIVEREIIDNRAHTALLEKQPGYNQEFRVIRDGKTYWMHENVSITPSGQDEFWLVGLVTDITAQRSAEKARQQSERAIENILTHAECLLWRATVTYDGEQLVWKAFAMPRSILYAELFGELVPSAEKLWGRVNVPDLAQMDARSRQAVLNGAQGYEQEFQAINPHGRHFRLQERVSIERIGTNEWHMVGVVTDITAQREAEDARKMSERRLEQLLERTETMLWQSQLTRLPDGTIQWESFFVPPSELFRRIFRSDPGDLAGFAWREVGVPEELEMQHRSERALAEGVSAYGQIFHVPRPEGDIWLSEQVSIVVTGTNQWDLVGIITDITVRRDAEVARLASDKRLKELLSRADCLLWEGIAAVTQDNWQWQFSIQPSVLCQRLYGTMQTSGDTGLWRMFKIPERAEMDHRCRSAMMNGVPDYEQVFHIVKDDGRIVWIKESVTVKPLGENRFSLVGVATDITAQRSAEEAVRGSESRYRSLFQHTPVAIMEADFSAAGQWLAELKTAGVRDLPRWLQEDAGRISKGAKLVRVTNANETALRLMKAKSMLDFHRRRHLLETPDSLRVIRDALLALWEGRNTLDAEFDMQDLEGGRHLMNMRWWIGGSDSGVDLKNTVMVYIDLTELKKTEAELAAEKERLAVTLRAMTEGVITTDDAGRILFINPAAAMLTEWAADQATGRLVGEVCAFKNNRTGATVEVPISRVAQGDVVVNLPAQTRLVTKGGSNKMVEGCCAPIHSAASKVMGAVLVFRDVTQQEQLEQELVRATRLESVGVLAGGIAHDFNNILTAVMGNIALGLLDVAEDSPIGVSLKAAEKAAARARDLTQQLLTFAKGGEPVRTAVRLEAIMREMTTFALHGSQVKATYDFAADLWSADADKGQIGRVVQNLVINAVQAMSTGGSLRVSAHNDCVAGLGLPGLLPGDYILISITDSGEGIPPENLARIFDPYFTTKQTGSGLGLAAVYSIIKKHRGHIAVESHLGQGTTFRIWLPALHDETEQAATRPPMAPAAMKGRVLFMDDDDIIREMATQLLKRFGLDVECAADGAEMVEKYRTACTSGRPFTLVVMDLTVPGGMGGLMALKKLKEIDPEVKAIVSSGYSSDPVLANHRAHGFSGVIAKPYDIQDFSKVLREVLNGPKN